MVRIRKGLIPMRHHTKRLVATAAASVLIATTATAATAAPASTTATATVVASSAPTLINTPAATVANSVAIAAKPTTVAAANMGSFLEILNPFKWIGTIVNGVLDLFGLKGPKKPKPEPKPDPKPIDKPKPQPILDPKPMPTEQPGVKPIIEPKPMPMPEPTATVTPKMPDLDKMPTPQGLKLVITGDTMAPMKLTARRDTPTALLISTKGASGCVLDFQVFGIDAKTNLQPDGMAGLNLGSLKPGNYNFGCADKSKTGVLTVE